MTTEEFAALVPNEGGETVMSNSDHRIEPDAEEYLQSGHYGIYPAWEFYGTVIHHDDQYHCLIKRHYKEVEVLSAPSLKELMEVASDKYGWR